MAKTRIVLGAIALGLIYFCVSYLVARPYRLVPSDDFIFLAQVNAKGGYSCSATFNPIHCYSLALIKTVSGWLGNSSLDFFLISSLFWSTGILLVLTLSAYQVTQSVFASLFCALLYSTSSWVFHYSHWYSFAIEGAFFLLLATYFAFVSVRSQQAIYPIAAGLFCALAFWTTSSAALYVLILSVAYVGMLLAREGSTWQKPLALYLATIGLLIALPYLLTPTGREFNSHILENRFPNEHQRKAQTNLGYIPHAPLASFLRILFEFNPYYLAAAGLAMIGVLAFRRYPLRFAGALAILIGLVVFHCMATDFLPHTKLARSQFICFPILVWLIAVTLDRYRGWRWRLLCLGLLAVLINTNLTYARELGRARRETPRVLQDLAREYTMVYLKEDHNAKLVYWWAGLIPKVVTGEELNGLVNSGAKVAWLSGREFSDLNEKSESLAQMPRLLSPAAKNTLVLGTALILPGFHLEEEIAMATYFERGGKAKPHSDPVLYLFSGEDVAPKNVPPV